MKVQNIRFLENLSTYASFSGVFNIFLGLLIVFIDSLNQDWRHIQVGLYIFITGYAFAKMSQKINRVTLEERKAAADAILQAQKKAQREAVDIPSSQKFVFANC